jgi:hypothetical protein
MGDTAAFDHAQHPPSVSIAAAMVIAARVLWFCLQFAALTDLAKCQQRVITIRRRRARGCVEGGRWRRIEICTGLDGSRISRLCRLKRQTGAPASSCG